MDSDKIINTTDGRGDNNALGTGDSQYRVVAITASAGGPGALEVVLGSLGPAFPLPVLVVQHMMPAFVGEFATWLDQMIPLTVRIARNGDHLHSGCVYLAPENVHLRAGDGLKAILSDDPPSGYHRPSANCMFSSFAQHCARETIGIVLTGMGNDGLDGIRELHEAGGTVIAQDESTCVVYGMPEAVVAANVVDEVLSLADIGPRVRELANKRSTTKRSTGISADAGIPGRDDR